MLKICLIVTLLHLPGFQACLSSGSSLGTTTGSPPSVSLSPAEYNSLNSASAAPKQNTAITGGESNVPKGCGHSKYWNEVTVTETKSSIQSRIVGGVEARLHEFPWQARLSISGRYLCGGAIINQYWILTAAHCAELVSTPSATRVYLGDHDVANEDVSEIQRTISRVETHPSYSTSTMNYDFALLKMSSPVTFDDWAVQPVCLPQNCSDQCVPGDFGFVSGWGTTTHGGSASDNLLKAKVPIISNAKCNTVYGTSTQSINDAKLCAGYDEGGVDTCQGDSGGPLTCPKFGYFMLMGVTSYGRGCAEAGAYGVYARVCQVLDWIATTVGESGKSLYYFTTVTDGTTNNDTAYSKATNYYRNALNSQKLKGRPLVVTGAEDII